MADVDGLNRLDGYEERYSSPGVTHDSDLSESENGGLNR